jgi:alpha-glucosidase (family GH31 glycosyl hydrolase)
MDDLLADREHTLALNRFYLAGGETRPATPTECRVAYDGTALFVAFRCQENNMSFPAGLQKADWYSLAGLPSGSDSWPPFPDEVDLLIQPDAGAQSYYQFAVTPDASKYGCVRVLNPNAGKSLDSGPSDSLHVSKVDAFEASVARRANEWIVFLKIPWATLGGKPQSHFGLLPMRTRWRDGEFSSPVAIDFHECLPVDILIETHFPDAAPVREPHTSLCQLPSGIARWQRPVALSYPNIETIRQVWRMESSLAIPTEMNSLAQRLSLTQSWIDLLTLEGFLFVPATGSIIKEDMTPANFRQTINAALRSNEPARACQLLDVYLRKLDTTSRDWFADGSPGDILKEEWVPITAVDSLEVSGDVILMRCAAGSRKVNLRLALPKTGGVRIFTTDEGYYKPADLLPPKLTQSAASCSIQTADGRIVIGRRPFSISFYHAAGSAAVTQIGPGNLTFRFSSDGKILAADFRNHLDPGEVIYGFGEKYDRFNRNGNVLTLWGMDDWLGNGMGLRNTTYKPLPVFHSSKGYMVFNNSSYRLRADVGRTYPNQYRLTQHGPIFDYYFWIGSPDKALRSYSELTGKPILPPKWAFGQWMGRGGGAWRSGALHDAVAEEENVTKRFAELDIPHAAIYAEGPSAFSPALNEFMAARGIKVLGYFMPAVRPAQQQSLMPELKPDELPVLQCGTENETRSLGYLDFTSPRALELCRQWWKRGLDLGVAGSMVDYGDRVPEDAVFYDGRRGAEMHNFYYHAYQRTISAVFREKRGNDFILFARGAAPGTQQWVGQFAGDHSSNFDGLRAVLTGALNLCACGFSNWGSDLGGYFGVPEPAVYIRWTQFGLFSPLMRWHGKAPREPWYYGEAAVANYKFCAWARENLLNYIYNAASAAHESGIPIIRSMAVAFPGEQPLAAVRDQYMFGEDLLVAPVIDEHNSRTILFPSGLWTDLWDGKTVSGPVSLKRSVPLERIPVYLRQGAVLPVQLNRELQFGQSMTGDRVTALVVTPPMRKETVSRLNAQGELAKVTGQPVTHGFRWTLENLPETSHFLVYGRTDAARVRVDGEVLPKVAIAGFRSAPAGWAADPAGNRLLMRLPPAQAPGNGAAKEIELDSSSSKK